jgi:hypothetical protein
MKTYIHFSYNPKFTNDLDSVMSKVEGQFPGYCLKDLIPESEYRIIAVFEKNGDGGGGGGGSSGGGNTINGTVQARELKITIAPVLTIYAEDDVFIGAGSVQEFSDIVGTQIVNIVKDAIETGQINLTKYGN